ncbi:MAG: YihY/virulence factor BrkB family protein, partial [Desulfobacterales bacterium]
AMLVSISFILLVSLVMNAIITEIGRQLSQWIGKLAVYLMVFDAMLLDLGATTVLFAMYFRYLPDAKIKWQDTWFGALLTAVVFTGGKYLIAIFIGNSEVADLYDAAGSILVLMLWVYYASAIFLFGATFTFTRAELMSNGREMGEDDAGIKL